MATSPLSGFVFPHRISSSVDLPDPFGPITPMRSPSDTVNEIFLNSGATPYRFASPWALIIGGNSLGLLPPLVYPEERRHGQFAPTILVQRYVHLTHQFDALILGAGAAGLLCAVEAGKRGRRVAVLERADRIGKKILISGGGRCNFTNLHCRPENFISANEHFAKSALARYTPSDFIALVEKHHISYHEKTLGQLFCDRSAQDIINMLEAECREAGAQIFLNIKIQEVQHTTEFVVRTDSTEFRAPVLVIATGGLSIPKIGATAQGYDLARQFGLKIVKTRPALVPLVLARKEQSVYCDLAGVSVSVVVSTD